MPMAVGASRYCVLERKALPLEDGTPFAPHHARARTSRCSASTRSESRRRTTRRASGRCCERCASASRRCAPAGCACARITRGQSTRRRRRGGRVAHVQPRHLRHRRVLPVRHARVVLAHVLGPRARKVQVHDHVALPRPLRRACIVKPKLGLHAAFELGVAPV